MEPSELSLEPIRADTLVLLQSESAILHAEFQVDPKPDVPFRVADYRLRGYRRYPDRKMHQVVIYLRKTNSPLVSQTCFEISGMRHEYQVIRLWEQPFPEFLQVPGLISFAALSQADDPEQVLHLAAAKINQIADRRQQSNIMAATALLAGLVLEKKLIYQVLRQDIMKESVIFQDIEAAAEARGEARGIQKVAVKLLNSDMGISQIAQVTGLSTEDIQQLQQKLQSDTEYR